MIQIGLPRVAETASLAHFGILRHWLSECDEKHRGCHPDIQPRRAVRPPTRLIDVGTKDAPTLRLFDTQSSPNIPYKYIALSHPWGSPPHFCTYRSSLAQHKQRIPDESPNFPNTFRDAITTARELGIRHLWIDSICIIQGADGDFNFEAKRMEDVFSSAYCVIAASSARGQSDGFLKKSRKQRQYLKLRRGEGDNGSGGLYVCRFIDNFGEHVLNSPLSKRGWVLQERALARRTIYFTDWQTYWECGDGVRCETMTKIEKYVRTREGFLLFLTDNASASLHLSWVIPTSPPNCRANLQIAGRRSASTRISTRVTPGWTLRASRTGQSPSLDWSSACSAIWVRVEVSESLMTARVFCSGVSFGNETNK